MNNSCQSQIRKFWVHIISTLYKILAKNKDAKLIHIKYLTNDWDQTLPTSGESILQLVFTSRFIYRVGSLIFSTPFELYFFENFRNADENRSCDVRRRLLAWIR